jgi:O-antigen/teichoic acid export membrane protein
MGYIQKDAFRTMLLSYVGMVLGYVNKGLLFIFLLTSDQVGLINLVIAVGLLLAQMSNLGSIYAVWKFFPFFRNESKKHYGFLFMNMLIVAVGVILFLFITLLLKTEIASFYLDKSALFVDYFFLILPIGASMVYFYLFENYMRGMNKNILPVFLNEFMLRVLLTILLICFAFHWISFNQLIYIYAYTHFIPPTILLIYLIQKKEITFSLKAISIPKRFKRIIINYSAYSYINSIGIIIVLTLDAMMLASMVGLNATGVYTTIIYLISAIQVPYKSLIRTSSPLIPVYWKEKKTNRNERPLQTSKLHLLDHILVSVRCDLDK